MTEDNSDMFHGPASRRPFTVIASNMKRNWLIVLGCFIGVSVSISPAYLAVFGLFLKPMADEIGLSRTELSMAPSFMALVAAICSPFIGGLIDRWASRRVVIIAVLMLPLGLLGHSMLQASLPAFIFLSLFMGVSAAIACPLPYISALPQWFDRNLGLAISLSMTGVGFGQILLPKIAAYLINDGGWRHAWAIMAGIILVVGVLNAAFLFRDNPEFQARKKESLRNDSEMTLPGISLGEAVRTPIFWLLGISVCLVAQVGVGAMIHIVPMLTDRGISPIQAANVIAIFGIGSLAGRLMTGFALDRLSIALVGGVLFSMQGLGMLVLWSEMGGSAPYIAVFFVGLAVGAETDIIPFATRKKFGLRQFGKIFGSIYGIFSLGPVLGPLLMGSAFDALGSYSLVLLAFSISSFTAAAFIVAAGKMNVKGTKSLGNALIPEYP